MARDDPHFRLRLPVELRDLLQATAAKNMRSINAEIIDRLTLTFVNEGNRNISKNQVKLSQMKREMAIAMSNLAQAEQYYKFIQKELHDIEQIVHPEPEGE